MLFMFGGFCFSSFSIPVPIPRYLPISIPVRNLVPVPVPVPQKKRPTLLTNPPCPFGFKKKNSAAFATNIGLKI
jgi:hypothetical protein